MPATQSDGWMSWSATPATQSEGGCQTSRSATPNTQSEGGCHEVPRGPRKVKVDVTKCHAWHAKWRCHANWRWMWPSDTLATQSEGGCHHMPRLPRKVKVDVTPATQSDGWMSWSATPATQSEGGCQTSRSATPNTQSEGGCHEVPRRTRKVKVDVTKCHTCHAKWRWMSRSATPTTQSEGGCQSKWCDDKLCVCDHVRTSCVRTSCVWASCVWTSCVWTSCVWASGVMRSCVWASCVWASGVMTSCAWASCVMTSFVMTSGVWASGVMTSCVWASRTTGGGRTAGYRTKNKNPTQRCGEKHESNMFESFFFVEHHSSSNGHFWPVFPTNFSQVYFPERIQAANMDDGLRCTTNQSLCDGTLERSHADIPKQQSLRATD